MEQIYTHVRWDVREGNEERFVAAWKRLAQAWAGLAEPPLHATLVQSLTHSHVFFSFGPWPSLAAAEAVRSDPRCEAALCELLDLVREMQPDALRVIAEIGY